MSVSKESDGKPSKQGKITISNRQDALPIDKRLLRRLVKYVADEEGCKILSIDVAIVSADEIERLNRKYLNREGITDVMSFDLSEVGSDELDGQIVVCADAAALQSKHYGLDVQDELMLYVIHGLLHLIGYDDTSADLASKMRVRQKQILENFKKLYGQDKNR